MAISTNLFGPYKERYEAIRMAATTYSLKIPKVVVVLLFRKRRPGPWQEQAGVLPIEFDLTGRVRPKRP